MRLVLDVEGHHQGIGAESIAHVCNRPEEIVDREVIVPPEALAVIVLAAPHAVERVNVQDHHDAFLRQGVHYGRENVHRLEVD